MLAGHRELACTAGTGIVPLCAQAAAVWRKADGRPGGPLPALALVSIRALATSMISSVLAREGKSRWCEFATAPPRTAETLLKLYPGTSVLCLHRACPEVIRTHLGANPLGTTGAKPAPLTTADLAGAAAALAGYWAAQTEALLAFERDHQQACLRVRYEDLADAPDETLSAIRSFAGLSRPSHQVAPGTISDVTAASAPGDPAPGMRFPAERLPPALLARVNNLLQQLDYPPLPRPGLVLPGKYHPEKWRAVIRSPRRRKNRDHCVESAAGGRGRWVRHHCRHWHLGRRRCGPGPDGKRGHRTTRRCGGHPGQRQAHEGPRRRRDIRAVQLRKL